MPHFHRLIHAAAAATAAVAGSAAAQMAPAPVGAKYAFDCTTSWGPSYREEYKIVKVTGDDMRVEVTAGPQKNWYEKPFWLIGTTLVRRESLYGRESTMSGVPANFAELGKLTVGATYSAYVTERRPEWKPLPWKYTISVVGRETAYDRELGELPVIAIAEERWVDIYKATMLTHYAPALRFPVFWRYLDVNDAKLECKLASAEGFRAPGAPLVAAAPAPSAVAPSPAPPAPAAAPPPRPAATPPAPPAPATGLALKPADPPRPPSAPAAGLAPRPAATAPAPPAATPPSAPVLAPSIQERLARLTELRNLGLITSQEYDRRVQEVQSETGRSPVARELEDANRLFLAKQIPQDEFVKRRAAALAKISPTGMPPKDALVLLNQLLDAKLISPAEHAAKRQDILTAM